MFALLRSLSEVRSGHIVLDGLTLFFLVITGYAWLRWLVANILSLVGYYTDTYLDFYGRAKIGRRVSTLILFLLICIQAAAYFAR